jgi:HEAT repeat protein
METILALAAAAVLLGLGPMAYVLLRQARSRRQRSAALLELERARTLVTGGPGADLNEVAGALAAFDVATIDVALEQLFAQPGTPEQRVWLSKLAAKLGVVERYCQQARHARTWNARAQAVSMLGKLAAPGAVATLAEVLRDRNEDDAVRRVAADAMAALADEDSVGPLIAELRLVDEQATSRVAEALIRFGSAATQGLVALLAEKDNLKARVWSARILAATRDPRSFDALHVGLRDRSDLFRAACAEALGQLGDERALQMLMQVALRDPAPIVRSQAATAAALIGGTVAVDVLVAALGDPDYATRLRALEAFESMRLSDTSPLEKALGDSNAEVRRRASLALERLGYLDRIVEQLASPDKKARAASYAALLQLGRAGVVEAIVGRLRHESMQVRAAIAKACGELRAERVGPALIEALDDPAWPVRATLCESIGQLRPTQGGPALVAMLADPEESVREAAATALATYAGTDLKLNGAAIRVVFDSGNIPVRLAMLAIAHHLDDPDVRQLLVDATHDSSEAVRLRAVANLVGRPNAAAIPALVAALTDPSLDVRMAAIPALGAAGTAESFEALLRTLPGAPPELRERVAEALSGVGRQHFLGSIEALARSEILDIRIGVAWTLGKIGDPQGIPVLCSFLRDPDARLRASAAGALGKIPSPAAIGALVSALDDPDPKTRAALVNALGKTTGSLRHVRDALERRLYDPDAFVRNRAGIALARVSGPEAEALARSQEAAQLLDDAALTVMLGLVGTAETVALALRALADPARLPDIQRYLDREEPAVCTQFLQNLRLNDGATPDLATRLDPAVLVVQYVRLMATSPDSRQRRAAVEAVAGLSAAAHVGVFADALSGDPDDDVRLRCAQVLAGIDEEVARSALIKAIADPNPKVGVAAVEGLRGRHEPSVTSALFRRLGAAARSVSDAIEQALAELYRDDLPGFIDRAMGASRQAPIVAAVRVLALMGQPSAMPLLRELLRAQDPGVRAAAVLATARTAAPESAHLVARMLDDPHELVRIAALEAIADDGARNLGTLLLARSDPAEMVRAKLCLLLDRFPGAASRRIVEAMVDDSCAEVRAAALLTLLVYADVESLRRFADQWTDAAPDTIRAAQSEARAPIVTRRLANLLAVSADTALRTVVVFAIGALAVENYEQILLPVLRDPRSVVRTTAARALASSSKPHVKDRLRDLQQDPEFAAAEPASRRFSRPISKAHGPESR